MWSHVCDSKGADELAPPPLPLLLPWPTVASVVTREIGSEWESIGAEETGGVRMIVGSLPLPLLASVGADSNEVLGRALALMKPTPLS